MQQTLLQTTNPIPEIEKILARHGASRPMLVCGRHSFRALAPYEEYRRLEERAAAVFTDFSPNPQYGDVLRGVALYREAGCDAIIAVGGGSAMDTAKLIRAYAPMAGCDFLATPFLPLSHPMIALPTTAGSGSESTRFAVIYHNEDKHSLADPCLLPDYALLDERALYTLPDYQKRCTLADALSQAIESYWARAATDESRAIARESMTLMLENYAAYLAGDAAATARVMRASNLAGQAINITLTTAAHAMSYQLTGVYNVPHGRAVFVCLPYIWEYMLEAPDLTDATRATLSEIAAAIGCPDARAAIARLVSLNGELFGAQPVRADRARIPTFARNMNPARLQNTPVALPTPVIEGIYEKAFAALAVEE